MKEDFKDLQLEENLENIIIEVLLTPTPGVPPLSGHIPGAPTLAAKTLADRVGNSAS